MTLVWVTGISGSGKSTVCEALRHRGTRAVDADWEGFNQFVHRATGEVVVVPPSPAPPHWMEQHAWMIKVDRVAALATSPGVTYLCGYAENEDEVWHLFDQAVCLLLDESTLRQRLATRVTNTFGKSEEELAIAIARNREMEAEYIRKGAALVDATLPIDEVVRAVLALAVSGAGVRSRRQDTVPVERRLRLQRQSRADEVPLTSAQVAWV